jgi:hypothetical protein
MKKIILMFVLATSVVLVNAQSKQIEFGAGINIGVPVGDFGKAYSFGIGAEGQGEYALSENASLVGSLGYTNFFGKKDKFYEYKYKNVGIIPILVGARYYPSEQFFVGGKLGYGIFTGGGSGGSFNFVPQVGYNVSDFQVTLDFHLLAQNGGNASYFGVSGIYKFTAKK